MRLVQQQQAGPNLDSECDAFGLTVVEFSSEQPEQRTVFRWLNLDPAVLRCFFDLGFSWAALSFFHGFAPHSGRGQELAEERLQQVKKAGAGEVNER